MNVSLIRDFFKGRTDAYVQQKEDGSYNCIKRSLTDTVISEHLNGNDTIGIYPVTRDSLCSLAVIDVDISDKEIFFTIAEGCKDVGMREDQLLREFSGKKGHHLFVFTSEPVPAWKLLRLNQIIMEISGAKQKLFNEIEKRYLYDLRPNENFVPYGKFGHAIKLPLGFHKVAKQKSYFMDGNFNQIQDWESCLKNVEKISLNQLDGILEKYKNLEIEEGVYVTGSGSKSKNKKNEPQHDYSKISSKVIIEKEKHRILSSGIYEARFITWNVLAGCNGQPIYELMFLILDGDYKGQLVKGIVNVNSNGKHGKLWQLNRALTGMSCNAGEEFDIDNLKGKECFINVIKKENKKKKDKFNNAIEEYISKEEFKDVQTK